MISALYWDRSLPWSVEAFVFASQQGDDTGQLSLRNQMQRIHRDFLTYYGLSAVEVPLLRYTCSQLDAMDGFMRPVAKLGTCFEDVST